MLKKEYFFVFLFVIFFIYSKNVLIADNTNWQNNKSFLIGVDISYLIEIEKSGGKYFQNNREKDFFEIIKMANFNTVRIRVWNENPEKQCSIDDAIILAKRAKEKGLKYILCLHYSDVWADPANQSKPKKWENLSFNELLNEVENWTFEIMEKCKENNVLPDYIQIGNEISGGFLWNEGRVGGSYNNNWKNFVRLLEKAIDVVRKQDRNIGIIIHHNDGSKYDKLDWFFGKLKEYGVDYDLIGVSYYPFYSKDNIEKLSTTIEKIQKKYSKKVLVLETSYPWTYNWKDNTHNVFGKNSYVLKEFEVSKEGQKKYFEKLIKELKKIKSYGVIYWGAEWISTERFGSMWENQTFFDFDGNALPIIQKKY